jgi:hypothetical protein
MPITVIFVALTMLATSQFSRADDGPFASAREGKFMCYAPNSELKTCASLSRLEWDTKGNVWEDGELAISANPLVTVKTKVKAAIEGSTLCETVGEATSQGPIFLVDGKPASEEEHRTYSEAYGARFKPLDGMRICIDISPYESVFITQVTINGTPYPSATSRLKWVSADEGYVVAR